MCAICTEWNKGKMTSKEALQNLGELLSDAKGKTKEHYQEVVEKILDKEVPLTETDEELDKLWSEENN